MKFLSSSFVKNIDFTVSFLKKMRIKKLVYGTMKPSKIGGGFMNQYNIIVQQLLAYLTKRKQCSSSRLSHKLLSSKLNTASSVTLKQVFYSA